MKVTTAGLDTDPASGDNDPMIWLDIENTGGSVNGFMAMAVLIEFYDEEKDGYWLGLSPESAEGDGVTCDYMYGGAAVAPGKKYAGSISFEGGMKDLKGIENLTLTADFGAQGYPDPTQYLCPRHAVIREGGQRQGGRLPLQ